MSFEGWSPTEGRFSRAALGAVLKAHVAILGGEGLKRALAEELQKVTKLGGQERRFAASAVRALSRHQRLLDWAAKRLGQSPSAWALKEDLALLRYVLLRRLVDREPWSHIRAEVQLPGPVRPRTVMDPVLEGLATGQAGTLEKELEALEPATLHSMPGWLASAVEALVPAAELAPLLKALNAEPGLLLRMRGPAGELMAELAAEGVKATALGLGTDALGVDGVSHQIFDTRAFKSGRLQVQDLGSQLIGLLCRPVSGWAGARVMDVCAGAGGKTLLLADQVGARGRVDASDASKKRLSEARRRAGELRLAQVMFPEPLQLEKADAVLIDAPCSGTGSLAREPDQKWRMTEKGIAAWVATQAELLEKTSAAMRAGSVLVYATCSLLRAENDAQVERFLAAHPEWTLEPAREVLPEAAVACEGPYLRALPHRVRGGAFFAARMLKS